MDNIVYLGTTPKKLYIADENNNIIFSYMEKDTVNHPEHYKRDNLPECKDLISAILEGYSTFLSEEEIFWLGNVIKYIYRAPLKNKREDLKKALKYLEWLVQRNEE